MRRVALLLIVVALLAPAGAAQYVNTNATGFPPITYAQLVALGPIASGRARYCSDCTQADTCANSGTGALALRINGAWSCRAGGAAAFPASATSAQLAASLTDDTGGSGVAVFNSSPTIVTPTIASFANAPHNHTNAAGGGTLTDAALSAAVTAAKGGTGADTSGATGTPRITAGVWSTNTETGTGSHVRATAPTLTTPALGNATGATIVLTNSGGGGTFVGNTSGTNAQYVQLQNTSGAFILGVDSSVGGNLFVTGTAAYEIVLATQTATGFTVAPALTKTFRFSGTDFAATSIGNTITPGQTGGIVGTTTNNNAQAGSFGEYSTGTTSANTTSLSTGTTANVGANTNITLTAGDWDCTGVINFTFGATTSITNLAGGISTTTATLPAQDSYFDYETSAIIPTGAAVATWNVPAVRLLLSASTNVFLVAQATFTASTLKVGGTIRCRRMR